MSDIKLFDYMKLKALCEDLFHKLDKMEGRATLAEVQRDELEAVIAEQKETIELFSKALGKATSICWSNFNNSTEVAIEKALTAYESWKGKV